MRIAREEVFGPVVSVLECESFEEAVGVANGIQYGLSTALYSRNVNLAFKAMRDLEAGIMYINVTDLHFVISTGAQRSGEICSFPQGCDGGKGE